MIDSTVSAAPFAFDEQIEHLRQKINLPTDGYMDIYGDMHNHAFVVAGANTAELVSDFRTAVADAIENGKTLEQFQEAFDEIVQKHNWNYHGNRDWRSRLIYDTNMYSSYNRGRYAQQRDMIDIMPYWQYEHHDNGNPRLEHKRLDGKVILASDPWWNTYYPTRGYGCHCTVRALDDVDLEIEELNVEEAPPIEYEERTVGTRSFLRKPQTMIVPKGVDPSFYQPQRLTPTHNVDQMLMARLANNPRLSPEFVSGQIRHLMDNPIIKEVMNQSMKHWVDGVSSYLSSGDSKLLAQIENFKYLGALPKEVLDELPKLLGDKVLSSAVIAMDRGQMVHALRDVKKRAGIALPDEFWEKLPEHIQNPDAILWETGQDVPTLLFVYGADRGKVALKVNYKAKAFDGDGDKWTTALNMVVTGSTIKHDDEFVHMKNSYQLLFGKLDW